MSESEKMKNFSKSRRRGSDAVAGTWMNESGWKREKERKKKKLEKISKSEKFQDRFLVETGRQLSGRPGLSSGECPAKFRKSTFSYSYCPEHPLLSYIGKRLSKMKIEKIF